MDQILELAVGGGQREAPALERGCAQPGLDADDAGCPHPDVKSPPRSRTDRGGRWMPASPAHRHQPGRSVPDVDVHRRSQRAPGGRIAPCACSVRSAHSGDEPAKGSHLLGTDVPGGGDRSASKQPRPGARRVRAAVGRDRHRGRRGPREPRSRGGRGGYPFVIQLWGAELWEATQDARTDRFTVRLLDAIESDIYARLDIEFYAGRIETLTPSERDLVLATAACPYPPVRTSDIRSRSTKSGGNINVLMGRLTEQGVIFRVQKGLYEHTAPKFHEYLKRRRQDG